MAFWGTEFIFDDIPCSEFGLMVYHFGSNGQDVLTDDLTKLAGMDTAST